MTSRTIVSFQVHGEKVWAAMQDAPINLTRLGESDEADVSLPPGMTPCDRGDVLYARLAANGPVREGLQFLLSRPPGAEPSPLYFHIGTLAADPVPWEELHTPQGFCALDARWPVGRIAKRRRDVRPRTFTPPFRIVAVLSAAERTGIPQLNALIDAVRSPEGGAIGTTLHVISGEAAVLAAAAEANSPSITHEPIGADATTLTGQIARQGPHLLHLLCHGSRAYDVATLAFATTGDLVDGETTTGSVRLTVDDLARAASPDDVWLTVLNACATAGADPNEPGNIALAHELTSAGFPAVIGMRRLVDLNDADQFATLLYPAVLQTVHRALCTDQGFLRSFDWACALTGPRIGMRGRAPEIVDTWADPVLYVQEAPFSVLVLSAPDATAGRDEQLRLHGLTAALEAYLAGVNPPPEARLRAEAPLREALARVET